jgi:RNA-binding protein NOB1
LILREDQREWQDAVKSEDIRRQKEERKLAKGVLEGWDNPDVSISLSGSGRELTM